MKDKLMFLKLRDIIIFVLLFIISITSLRADINKKLDSILLEAHESNSNQDIFRYLNDYLKLAVDMNLPEKEAKAYYELTKFSWLYGYYSNALEYSKIAIEMYKQLGDRIGEANTYMEMGNVYSDCLDTLTSMDYYLKAEHIYKLNNDKHKLAIIYLNLNSLYVRIGDIDKAHHYSKIALELFQEIKDTLGIAYNYVIMGLGYLETQDFIKALENYKKGNSLYEKINADKHIGEHYVFEGLTYHNLKDKKNAKHFVDLGLHYLNKYNTIDNKYELLGGLIKYYDDLKMYDKSSFYYSKLISLKDTIYKYNIKAVEKKFELLQQEEKFKVEVELMSRNQYYSRILTIFIVSIAILIIGITTFFLIQKNKRNKEIGHINKQLEALNTTKDKFFSIISHDLRTPLNSFNALVASLNHYYDNFTVDEIKKHIGTLKKSSDNLLLLLENLLLWANLQSKDVEAIQEHIDLSELIDKEINNLSEFAEIKEIEILNHVKPNQLAFADKDMISVVIRNLLANSIKFSKTKSEVNITGHSENGYVKVSVSDNGVDIIYLI